MIQAVLPKMGTPLVAPVADVRINSRITFHYGETVPRR
jgi:hypothetical protein